MRIASKAGAALAALLTAGGIALSASASAQLAGGEHLSFLKTDDAGKALPGATFSLKSCGWTDDGSTPAPRWLCETGTVTSGDDGVLRGTPTGDPVAIQAQYYPQPGNITVSNVVTVTETSAPNGYQLDTTPRYYAATTGDGFPTQFRQVKATANVTNLATGNSVPLNNSQLETVQVIPASGNFSVHVATWKNQLKKASPAQPPAGASGSATGSSTGPSRHPGNPAAPANPGSSPRPGGASTTAGSGTAGQSAAGNGATGPKVQTDADAQAHNGVWPLAGTTLAAAGAGVTVTRRRKQN